MVGFLGEESKNFRAMPERLFDERKVDVAGNERLASACLSTFSGDSPRTVAITWKMRKNCVVEGAALLGWPSLTIQSHQERCP